MKSIFLLIIIALSLFSNANAQSFDVLWKNVNDNLENNLPESAKSDLDKIEQKAKNENNQKELLKSYLYRFKIFSLSEENPLETSINFATENVTNLKEPEKAIFNIAIASLYESSLLLDVSNQQIFSGQQTAYNGQQSLSMKFWDKATFERVINKYYENALSDINSLQNNSAESYKEILAINNETANFDFNIEPTLYDYVLHKMINRQVNNSANQRVADLYDSLISFDKKNNYNDAAMYNEIKKLEYEYETYDDYETYFNSLEKIKNENIDNPLVTSVMALQARAILNRRTTDNVQQTSEDANERKSAASDKQMALDICNAAMKMFPDSKGAKQCESIRSEILQKELSLSMQNVVLPNKPIPVELTYRNLTNPHYRIYKVSQKELEKLSESENVIAELLKKNHITEKQIDIVDEKDYDEHSLSISLPELDCGIYYIMFSKDDSFSKKEDKYPACHSFQVSNLSYVTNIENNNFVVYVLDRESGKAVKDVNVNLYKEKYDYVKKRYVKENLQNLITDKNGRIILSSQNNSFQIDLYKDDDTLLSEAYFNNYQNGRDDESRERTYFFTDRAIYRPGQTVYYKGIILNENSVKKELLTGKETTVTLKDSNWEDVATQTFTTNDFGSFDGSFVIPNNVSNGYFQIKNNSGSIGFKVEEYKRPTFEITFNEPDKSFKINDSVSLTGSVKAYAGFALDNVNFNYTIVRRTYFPYRYWWFANYHDNERQIAFGDGTTDNKGDFKIDFQLLPDKDKKDELPVYEYIVTINATNIQGETQSKTYTLKASEIDLIIDFDNDDDIVCKDSLDLITFNVKNLKENPVEAEIVRRIYKVSGQQPTDKSSLLHKSQLIFEDTINVNGNYALFQNVNKNLETAKYVIELISAENKKANISKEITIIDLDSQKMPYETMCFSYYDKKTAQPKEKVNFYLGSSDKDVIVYMFIKHGNEVRRSERKTFSDKLLKMSYDIKEEDRGGISFQAFFVKDNTINIVKHDVSVPYDNLKLDIRLDVERDELLPGSQEKWNLTVKNYENEAVVANVLASMYDASLDVFAKNKWYFNTSPNDAISESPRSDRSFNKFSSAACNQYFRNYDLFHYYLMSDVSLLQPFIRYYKRATISAQEIMMMPARERDAISVSVGGMNKNFAEKADSDFSEHEFSITEEMMEISNYNESAAESWSLLRDNFNETAFFYPNMKTNDDGSLTLSFIMPDALTRWNLMMLAYTKDLKTGTLNKTFTTSKPLMIMSDMPRFCYENDTLWMIANVIRTTGGGQQITDPEHALAKLEIFDALTMKPLNLILSEQEIDLGDIPEGNSKSVRWKVVADADTDCDLLAFRFSVTSDNFSDAEQYLLPILSDEVFMTETYPLTIEPHSTRTFNFDFDNENERNQGVTLNYCSNPLWYAIQALPYLSQEMGDNADAAFNVFYANILASYIARNIPNFLNYIKEWQIETPDVLMSQLQKDENLKAIMLEETPWVFEAKTESEQKSRLANLFDINALRYKTDEVLNLIEEKQSVNGGWSWFGNMPESPFITQYILGGFGRLYKMNVVDEIDDLQQEKVGYICEKAISYLTNDIVKNYYVIKEIKNLYLLSNHNIDKLYALSFFDFEEKADYKEAKDFMIGKLQTEWQKFDFGVQAKIALILFRSGETETAQLIMKSLKERMPQLKHTSDVAAQTLVTEAFMEILPDRQILNEMTIGLLDNKRTNMWENAAMTVDAVYVILENSNWSSAFSQNQQSRPELMFIQRYWNSEELKDFKNLTLENQNDNIAWGGLFRQYFVSIDDVRKHESPLNVERELFVERVNENGTYLVPINEVEMKVGDKLVVNLTIEASQDMEFVFLKDLRAACFEPLQQMSQYNYYDGMSYYQSNSDTFMGFYFDNLSKGEHRVSYSMFVTKEGSFSNGYALIQCMYAPEFSAYSEGMRVRIENL